MEKRSLLLAAALLCAACGQKGPLYLPDAPEPRLTSPCDLPDNLCQKLTDADKGPAPDAKQEANQP